MGFAFGWVARSTVDSSRDALVKVVSLGFSAVEHVRRIVALERERLDDFIAESRQHAEGPIKESATPAHDGHAAARESH